MRCGSLLGRYSDAGALVLADFGPYDVPTSERKLVQTRNAACVLPVGHSGWHRTDVGPDGLQWENLDEIGREP